MVTINNLSLQDAKPTDYPHLILWDNPHNAEIVQIAFNNNAQIISYRDNLISRINSKQKYLILNENLDDELDAIKEICANNSKKVLILKDLDILISYLYSKPSSPISLFWKKLGDIRHLDSILWILLPTKFIPPNWDKKRIKSVVGL
ncbi:hypothetical protein [Trichormus sp. NMC-1]|uniref:hypothetical protein n=1 Tax=Trichormus sp. NMC-1 TaxID=1853259 RepID=UPI0008DC228A|nr:hypothetical protein [Trichormus sp. NMC-1]